VIASSSDTTGGVPFPANADDFGDDLNEDLRARVKTELEPGERLLWAGRSMPPHPRLSVAYNAWFTVGMLFLGFGLAAIVRALSLPRPRFNESDSTMGLGIGLGVVGSIILVCAAASWISERLKAARESTVCYAVTDRRAISWVPEDSGDAVRVHSWPKGRIGDVVRVERPDGSGNLEFTLTKDSRYYWPPAGFNHIREVRRVEQIVRHNLTTREDVS
jgi:hypothetical protein